MVLGPGLGLGLVVIKGASGHGDMGTWGETGPKGRPEIGMNAAVHEVGSALRADLVASR